MGVFIRPYGKALYQHAFVNMYVIQFRALIRHTGANWSPSYVVSSVGDGALQSLCENVSA